MMTWGTTTTSVLIADFGNNKAADMQNSEF